MLPLAVVWHTPYKGHCVSRLNWSAAHAGWRRNDLENILFTDECKVMLDYSEKRKHVYRRNEERFSDACAKIELWINGAEHPGILL